MLWPKPFNDVSTSRCETVDNVLAEPHKLLFFRTLRPHLGTTKPPSQWVPGFISGGISTRAWRWPLTCIYYRCEK